MVALLQSQQVTLPLLLKPLALPPPQRLTNMDPLDLLLVRPLDLADLLDPVDPLAVGLMVVEDIK